MSETTERFDPDECDRICAAATPEPWETWCGSVHCVADPNSEHTDKDAWFPRVAVLRGFDRRKETEANARLCLYARTALPLASARVRELQTGIRTALQHLGSDGSGGYDDAMRVLFGLVGLEYLPDDVTEVSPVEVARGGAQQAEGDSDA